MSAAKKLKPEFDHIKSYLLRPDDNYLFVIENLDPELDSVSWMSENRIYLETELAKYGAILFRGFSVGIKNFKEVVSGIVTEKEIMEYKAGYSPRKKLGDGVYTSTVFPSPLNIDLHQDQCYLPQWPKKLFLCSEIPAKKGGETPLVSVRKFMKHIRPEIVERVSKGVLYIRTLSEDSHMTWQDAYWTDSKADVELACKRNGVKFEWLPKGGLRTYNLSNGLIKHPTTKEVLWFNQAHVLSLYSEKPGVDSPAMRAERSLRGADKMKVLEQTKPEERFHICCDADGKPIEVSILEEIHQVFNEHKVEFPWQKGDLLMMDNVATAHGRNSFEGERSTLATQAQIWPPTKG